MSSFGSSSGYGMQALRGRMGASEAVKTRTPDHACVVIEPGGSTLKARIAAEDLIRHLAVHVAYRPECALIVDGVLLYPGEGIPVADVSPHIEESQARNSPPDETSRLSVAVSARALSAPCAKQG